MKIDTYYIYYICEATTITFYYVGNIFSQTVTEFSIDILYCEGDVL